MATTNSTLVAGTMVGRAGKGDDGRFGLRAQLTAGAVALGCAAALALGGLWAGESARTAPTAPAASFSQMGGIEPQRFLAANTELPDGTLPAIAVERQRFLEQNMLPELAPADPPALAPPGPTNFQGEDH